MTIRHVDTYTDAWGVWAVLEVTAGDRVWTRVVLLWRPARAT